MGKHTFNKVINDNNYDGEHNIDNVIDNLTSYRGKHERRNDYELEELLDKVNQNKADRLNRQLQKYEFAGEKRLDKSTPWTYEYIKSDKAFAPFDISQFSSKEEMANAIKNYFKSTDAVSQLTNILDYAKNILSMSGDPVIAQYVRDIEYYLENAKLEDIEKIIDGHYEELEPRFYYDLKGMNAGIQNKRNQQAQEFWARQVAKINGTYVGKHQV